MQLLNIRESLIKYKKIRTVRMKKLTLVMIATLITCFSFAQGNKAFQFQKTRVSERILTLSTKTGAEGMATDLPRINPGL